MSIAALIQSGKALIAVAAEIEARAVLAGLNAAHDKLPAWQLHALRSDIDLVVTGVGKAASAGAVARVLNPTTHKLVLSVGIAGTYGQAAMGSAVAATESVFADEGVQTTSTFEDLSKLGFPLIDQGMTATVPLQVIDALRPHCDAVGPIATVSTCSGTDDLALAIQRRTFALAEAMEGAAVGLVAHRLSVPFGELRVISNTTGDRVRQVWQIKDALANLSSVIGRLFPAT
jgi:futalosine hydrolase